MRYNYYTPLPVKNFAKTCLQLLKTKEIGVFLFFPKISRVRMADYVIQNYHTKYKIKQIAFLPDEADSLEDIDVLLYKMLGKAKQETIIFVTNADFPINQKCYQVIDAFVNIQEERPYLHFILLFETDITHPLIASHLTRTSIFANVNYYSLFKSDDASGFVDYLLNKWRFNIPDKTKNKIVEKCGGHLWLLKYAIRDLKDDTKKNLEEIFQSEQMQFRLEQIVVSFLDSEKKVLMKLMSGENITEECERHSYRYLKKMNLIKNGKITIPLLEDYLHKSLPRLNIQITDKHILLNDVRVDSHFSRQEKRTLKALLDSKNQVISRDQIAKAIWPINTEEKYSDWAVDRLIARLRQKITSLGMPKDLIKTFRNKGYMLII